MKKTVALPLLIANAALVPAAEKQHELIQKWDGQYYSGHAKLQFQSALQFLPALSLKSTEKVLDVGCGTGNITAEIAKQVLNGSVVGIDISQSMLEAAQNNYSGIVNLSFEQADARSLRFNNEFDRIVSFLALHWIKDQKAVLSSCFNSLKPGGLLNIFMVPLVEDHPLARSFDTTVSSKKWQAFLPEIRANDQYHGLTEESLRHLLEQTGFAVSDVHSVVFENRFDSVDGIKKHLKTWIVGFPAVSSLQEETREEFINDLADQYIQIVGQNRDGSYPYNRYFLIASAQKPING